MGQESTTILIISFSFHSTDKCLKEIFVPNANFFLQTWLTTGLKHNIFMKLNAFLKNYILGDEEENYI